MEVGSGSTSPISSIPLLNRNLPETEDPDNREQPRQRLTEDDNGNYNMHLMLLMTWLLPLTCPVLAVWVRTLASAGITTA